eukprot:6270381-Prymnesium_polylepis.1
MVHRPRSHAARRPRAAWCPPLAAHARSGAAAAASTFGSPGFACPRPIPTATVAHIALALAPRAPARARAARSLRAPPRHHRAVAARAPRCGRGRLFGRAAAPPSLVECREQRSAISDAQPQPTAASPVHAPLSCSPTASRTTP